MDLHTDGTYVKETTDWLLMTKIEEQNVQGGETAMLHLDDWEHCEDLFNDPVGRKDFVWGSPKSKNIEYKVEHPVFYKQMIRVSQKFPILINSLSQKIWIKKFSYKNYQMV